MSRIPRLCAAALVAATLLAASGLPAAAQGLGPCPFASDAALAQALGTGVQGQSLPSGSGNSLCAIVGVTPTPIVATHLVNVVPAGNPAGPDELARFVQNLPQGTNGRTLDAASIPGLGDAALFFSGSEADGPQGAMLIVQSGADTYTFAMRDPPPNAQDLLTTLAQAVLASAAQ
jgi:hypothetical protein